MFLMSNGFHLNKSQWYNFRLIITTLIWVMSGQNVLAQTINENTTLSFGKIVITDNSSAHKIEILPGGGYSADPQYIFFSDPQMANVSVDGYDPFVTLSVSISNPNLNRAGGGPAFFSVSDVFTNPAIIETDSFGSATFEVGATLSSNGNGAGFTNNKYDGNYTVTVTP